MFLRSLYIALLVWIIPSMINAQDLTPEQLIAKSIAYHDPMDQWKTFKDTLLIKQETPDSTQRFRTVFLDRKKKQFKFAANYKNGTLQYHVTDNKPTAIWNDSAKIDAETVKKYRITPQRALMYRNYYSYLYGMPMKLHDPGTIVHPGVEEVTFYGNDYYKIKVTYTPEVGKDTWFFYFDKNTYALGAYEFYKKKPGDGEYLLLEGIKTISDVKLPQAIKWYMTKGERWLGNDILR